MDDLIKDFISETVESLETLDTKMIVLEQDGTDKSVLNDIFRVFHTIKGTCGFLGFQRLEKVAHAAETILDNFRNGTPVNEDAISVILQAIDRIKMLVSMIENSGGSEPSGDDSEILRNLHDAAEGKFETKTDKKAVTTIGPNGIVLDDSGFPSQHIEGIDEDLFATPAADAIFDNGDMPSETEAVRAETNSAVVTATPEAEVATAAGSVGNEPNKTGSAPSASVQSVRVGVDLLEDLMNLVGELVLARNQLLQVSREVNSDKLASPVQHLSHVASDLQEAVMKTRMQAVGNAWSKFPRLVRDVSKDLGKKIDLIMEGQETEIDRQVLELIKDPLTHMVRNCCDHAVETPEERVASGKPETGRVKLLAFHEGGHIVIKIIDDGRGISASKIKRKAIEKGVITKEEGDAMSDAQLRMLIFKPGFSTADQVTSISGRGVGMDVVKTNVEKIGGAIFLDSTEGKGTEFSIKIPLTLAIVSAFIVEAGKEKLAIPMINVMEIVNVGAESGNRIERLNGIPVLRLRDRITPLVSIYDLLGMERHENSEETVMIVQVGSEIFGIIVDNVLDTEEIVVKPLSPALENVKFYSGNTILGDGSVIMIIDPSGVADSAGLGIKSDFSDDDDAKVDERRKELVQMLIFSTGEVLNKAVHLSVVSRLEQLETSSIKPIGDGRYQVKYLDKLMPIVCMPGCDIDMSSKYQQVIVFMENGRSMGLAVKSIIETKETTVDIDISSDKPGVIGNAIFDGDQPTEIIDISYFLSIGLREWFEKKERIKHTGKTIILVDDSTFFQNMLRPIIEAKGYEVICADNPVIALDIMKTLNPEDVQAIISDIEMPEMNGFDFCRELRKAGSPWAYHKIIALSSHATDDDIQRGRNSGFNDHLKKMDRDGLQYFLSNISEKYSV